MNITPIEEKLFKVNQFHANLPHNFLFCKIPKNINSFHATGLFLYFIEKDYWYLIG